MIIDDCQGLRHCRRMRIILIHGYKASSQSQFFPWLRDALHAKGHEVICPDLPEPDAPNPEEWTKFLIEHVGVIDDETIIVGHTLGATTALRFLEAAEARSTPKGVVLISPPWMIKNETFQGFFLSELDFDVLMWKASRFVVIHSHDDKSIPFDHAKKYADVLHAKLIERNDGEGHFTGERYPVILDTIENLIAEEITYAPGEELEHVYEKDRII